MFDQATIEQLFKQFEQMKVLIVGDVMLDKYVYGHVDRVSPEAPVPVVDVEKIEGRLGGAANVAMNIRALGATPLVVSVIGFDKDASEMNELFETNEITTKYMIEAPGRLTTSKTRVLARNQQMVRLDMETTEEISGKVEASVLSMAADIIKEEKPAVVIFEDYNKGILTEKIIREITSLCLQHQIPIAVDPKKNNFLAYKHCNLFKPNLREIKESIAMDIDAGDDAALQKAADRLSETLEHTMTMITLGDKGIYLRSKAETLHVPAHVRNVSDVSGAGDTVISVAALCLAVKTSMQILAELSNIAGGLVCESPGVVPVDKHQLMSEAMQFS